MSQPIFIYAALCALILIALSVYVINGRGTLKIGIGDGGNPVMLLRMRIHSNFIEYVPMALLLLYFVQIAGFSAWVVHVLGITLVLARLAHIYGLLSSTRLTPGRAGGVVGTFSVIVLSALLLLLAACGIRF